MFAYRLSFSASCLVLHIHIKAIGGVNGRHHEMEFVVSKLMDILRENRHLYPGGASYERHGNTRQVKMCIEVYGGVQSV